jgi:hypothetical protein
LPCADVHAAKDGEEEDEASESGSAAQTMSAKRGIADERRGVEYRRISELLKN